MSPWYNVSSFSDVAIDRLDREMQLWPTLLQAILTGVYVNIFLHTITPIFRVGQRKMYAATLTLLFGSVVVNLATEWQFLRRAMIVHDDDYETISGDIDELHTGTQVLLDSTSRTAIVLADIILVWRCYTLWARSKLLLLAFSPFLMAEAVLLVLLCLPALDLINSLWNLNQAIQPQGVPAFYFLSFTNTILATTLIFYRIIAVVKESDRKITRYSLTIEVVVESGAMYAATLLIISVLRIFSNRAYASDTVSFAESLWVSGVLPPITGIAPTLIAFRVARGHARDETTWSRSRPLSILQFKKPHPDTVHSDDTSSASITNNQSMQYNPPSQIDDGNAMGDIS